MDNDFITSLVQDGPQFEVRWKDFMVNLTQAQQLKMVAKKQDIEMVLKAGSRFRGTGWTPGGAAKVLFQLCQVIVEKTTLEPYRDVGLTALAIMAEVGWPTTELSQDCIQAAFALASLAEEKQIGQVNGEGQTELHFSWDEMLKKNTVSSERPMEEGIFR